MARNPRTFCNRPVSNRLLCFYHTLSAAAAVEAAVAAAVAAAQQQQQYTSAERHISRGGEQGAGRGVSCAEICPVLSLGMPCRTGI